jgi:hypothetical protein
VRSVLPASENLHNCGLMHRSNMCAIARLLDHLVGALLEEPSTSRLGALAVLRLIVSTYLAGPCTGKSVGFSPLLRQEQNSGRIRFCLLSICARYCCDNEEQETLQRDLGKSEQSRGSDPRSVPEAAEFGPDHVWSDTTPSCRRVEAAIGRGQHFRRVTDYCRHPFNPV